MDELSQLARNGYLCDFRLGRQVRRLFWARTSRRPTACLRAMGTIRHPRFPRPWLTSRRVPAAAIWAAVSRVVVRDGRPRPISSSWIGSAASIERSWNECPASCRHDLSSTPGVEALNANDFQQGFAGGPRLGLIRHGDSGYDFELTYFQIDGWSSVRTVGPYDPPLSGW